MLTFLDYLREENFVSVIFRLLLAMVCGGMLGLERARKGRAAGFRTYMFVCMGAALSVMLSQYEYTMLTGPWKELAEQIGLKTDVSRFGAQVINGIGFLGAGTIIVVGRQQVKGLTTAAGLWASGCLGLAIGAGFYELIIVTFPLMMICIRLLPSVETMALEHSRSMDIHIEFASINDLGKIINCIKNFDVQIVDIEVERKNKHSTIYPSVVVSIVMNRKIPHTEVLSTIANLDQVYQIEEI